MKVITSIRLTDTLREQLAARGNMSDAGRALITRYLELMRDTRKSPRMLDLRPETLRELVAGYHGKTLVDPSWIRYVKMDLAACISDPEDRARVEEWDPVETHTLVDALERYYVNLEAGRAAPPEEFLR